MLPLLLSLWLAADTGAADQLYRAGRYTEAASAYRQLIAGNPSSPEPLAGVGNCLLAMHNPREAVPYLSHALQLKPDSGEIRLTLARALLEGGNPGAATGLLDTLREKEPANTAALRLLAEALYRQGYYQNAINATDRLIALHADDVASRRIRAVALAKVGRATEAETACKRLMDAEPETLDVDVALTYVEILYDGGRYDAALPYADKVARQHLDNPIAPLWQARLLFRSGRIEEAARDAERCVSLAPGLPFGHSLLLDIYRKAGRAQDAQREAQWLRAYNDGIAGRGR